MALTPTGINNSGANRSELIRSIRQPQSNNTPRTNTENHASLNKLRGEKEGIPAQGFRIRTASTDNEIEAQISRLSSLIANDNIDMNAPAGSYINVLL